MSMKVAFRFALMAFALSTLAGCMGDVAPHTKQIPAPALALMATKGMKPDSPVFIRIFKEESELEIWKVKDGRFEHFKTYPICKWSGTLGPKLKEGDKQSPEGFYTVRPGQLNPASQFHLAFNLGYPNEFDRAHGRTGAALMVHGDCKSVGCYAMTDAVIEEIYAIVREAFKGGQSAFHVNAFPFRMTEENMTRHAGSEWIEFWRQLKIGYDSFEFYRLPPKVAVCSKQYLVNVSFMGVEARPDPQKPCPAYQHVAPYEIPGFENLPKEQQVARAPEPAKPASPQAETPPPAVETAAAEAPQPVAAAAVVAPTPPPTYRTAATVITPPALVEPQAEPPAATASVAAPSPESAQPDGGHQVRRSGKGDMTPPPAQPSALGYTAPGAN